MLWLYIAFEGPERVVIAEQQENMWKVSNSMYKGEKRVSPFYNLQYIYKAIYRPKPCLLWFL